MSKNRPLSSSSQQKDNQEDIELILPTTGKVFYEHKDELRLCQPHLMPLKSVTLFKLERMQIEAQRKVQEARSQVN